ncbi:MAG: SulP family inorganic anion transporter [Actinobacteria bacterium]|nr:SulP family inorganic anion transporter [Actinomycetota bacterium]
MSIVPVWVAGYRRAWLGPDIVAGLIVWGVVVPQAVAYAQIAGLPPEAGLVAAPGALIGYALLGSSRTLVVSATTATSAVSVAAVGSIAAGNADRFAALSVGFAIVSAVVLAVAGLLRLGRITDIVSKPVMTGFLFGLGLTVAIAQLPKLFGVPTGSGNFFPQVRDLLTSLGDTNGWTLAVGLTSVGLLLGLKRFAPTAPGSLIVLALGIVVSALLGLADRGVAVVGELPRALPDPTWPSISWEDVLALLPAALGILIVCAEAIGVSRAIAATDGYAVDPNRDLAALGVSNLLAGVSGGFVQSGGASQTMAAERAGGKTQLGSLVAAGLILLTGAFLGFLFADLPEATLAAIVMVAISGFYRVDELRRFARVKPSALFLALLALFAVLVLGVLPGLLISAGVSLILVIQRLSRPSIGTLAREAETGAWGRADRHPGWERTPGFVVARVDGPVFYANVEVVRDALLEAVRGEDPPPRALVLDLAQTAEIDLAAVDALGELAATLEAAGVGLRLASVRVPVLEVLRRSGLDEKVTVAPTLDAAVDRR